MRNACVACLCCKIYGVLVNGNERREGKRGREEGKGRVLETRVFSRDDFTYIYLEGGEGRGLN